MKVDKLLFGTAGVPISSKERSSVVGVSKVKELGLGCMELEFVRGVKMTPATANQVNAEREKHGIVLTAHGPYYINLTSPEAAKRTASIKRIYDTAKIADIAGAYSITFHAAYYMKENPEKVYAIVKESLRKLIKKLNDESIRLWIRPETTGKATQFGDLNELLKLSQDLDHVMPCIDFAHLHARSGGKLNTKAEFNELLELVEKKLGRTGLNNLHVHMSGINYTAKGERNHLILKRSDMNYKDLLKTMKEFKCKGVIISESPNIEEDALLMKRYFESL